MKLLLILTVSFFNLAAAANSPTIAVASNFSHTMNEVVKLFKETNGHSINISYGPSGGLYSQVINGAPFDAFFSADSLSIEKLDEKGLVVSSSKFIYAIGSLVYLCKKCNHNIEWSKLLNSSKEKVAIANPDTAPYGRASVESLNSLSIFNQVKPRIVYGNNIVQTFQFILSNNIPSGIVAKSLVMASKIDNDKYQELSKSLHSPITQEAAILKRSGHKDTLKKFFNFFKSSKVKEVILRNGYKVEKLN